MTKSKVISIGSVVAVLLMLAAFGVGYELGRARGATDAKKPSIEKAFDTATKAVEDACQRDGTGCNNLHAVSIFETDCSLLAPQNGNDGRCGFWTISYQAMDNNGRLRVFSASAYYNGVVKHVNEDNLRS